jgi:L-glyceraldehyde 3-phosphate reductase
VSNALNHKAKTPMHQPAEDRYSSMIYRRCGRTGLRLPAVSLGLWHNFGHDTPHHVKRDICRTAFDLGITHFDLANNYGPPPGSAEEAFGEILRTDFSSHRDELIISSKAGYLMWPGPYGEWGSRKYVIASCDQSLKRMELDYVDIFYSHRFDPETPLEETMGALDQIVRSGKALYAGISSYNSKRTREAAAILKALGTPCIIHQPSYSLINRWVEEDGLLDTLDDLGIGSIVFSPLAQGMLTDKYLAGIPAASRAAQGKSLDPAMLRPEVVEGLRALGGIAAARGQSLAQMAIAWVLRGGRVTSALIGASRAEQVRECVGALAKLDFTQAELAEIDRHARDANINLWAASAERDGPPRKKK